MRRWLAHLLRRDDSLDALLTLVRQKRYADALPRLLAAVAVIDRTTRAYVSLCGMLGWCYWQLDQAVAQAQPWFEAAAAANPTSNSYDVIVIRRTLQGVPDTRMPEATERLLARLAPRGVLINHAHNTRPDHPAFIAVV